ncbi:MAG: TIGR02099 family protein [Tatlockia sp.]|nr:TIGR02099 family protein [Tatlockia sp.]
MIVAAIISSLFRALTPFAKQYKVEVEQHLSTVFGEKVTIKTMETGWYWFEPVIKLNQISISDGKSEVIKLDNLLIGINILSSLWHWQIQPGILLIEDLHLGLHQEQESWRIDGIDGLVNHQLKWDLSTSKPILAWILAQQKIVIKNISAQVYMQDGTFIPLSNLQLKIANHAGHYYVNGKGKLAQNTETNFQVLADLILDPFALNKAKGHIFFSVQHLLPVQWQAFVPHSRFQIKGGEGSIKLWVDLEKGQPQNVQANMRFHQLDWLDENTQKKQIIQTLKANLAWKPTSEGWQLAADEVYLSLANTRWPKNAFMVNYKKENQDYFVFIKNIVLQSLLTTSITWPDSFKPILATRPHGNLSETQMQFKSSNLSYVLTRFSDLGWQGLSGNGVNNLSGALYWRPEEGRLELAGKKIKVSQKKQKPLTLTSLQSAFDWRKANDGLLINIEQLNLAHPNFLLNAQGKIDQITADSSGRLNLNALFSGKNAELLLPYLPSNHLKPKLEAWLKKDIKHLGELSGDLFIKGAIAEFPFDKQEGEFVVNTQIKGAELTYAHGWTPVKNMTLNLRVNKRNLEADIIHATLAKMTSYNSKIKIDDLGLDREILLFQTHFDLKAEELLRAIITSPLNKKLSALSMLELKGLLGFDLQIEAPLYPENDKILAYGNINFNNNQLNVSHSMDNLKLRKLDGSLQFNQLGIINSKLTALLYESPANLSIKSFQGANPFTEVKISGQLTAEVLNKKLNIPPSFLSGSARVESVLKLTDEPNDLDKLHLETSLEGLAIDLPPPLGKAATDKTPLSLAIDFNPQKASRLNLNYDNRLSSNLWFLPKKGGLGLRNGEIHLGTGQLKTLSSEGLHITGSLESFDLQQWLDLKTRFPVSTEQSLILKALKSVNLKVKDALIWNENFKDLTLKVLKPTEDLWSIQLKQESIEGLLQYQPKSNSLSGQFDKLNIKNYNFTNKTTPQKISELKPLDLPNLEMQIASLKLGELDLGAVSLKSKSLAKLWQLDYCEIKSPFYFLSVKGEWQQQDKIDSTTLHADLKISNLAKSLERLKINPTIEAQRGRMQFQGGWAGKFSDFQLAKLDGQVKIDLLNGRIMNLSPETEGKMGFGKLLSILSLQTIPRRLKLDFSDLSKPGYSFDKFEGSFAINKGIMNTQDSYIDGPVAYASIKGDLNLAKQFYNVDLKVTPHLTASLPIVATIAGGPVLGFATWAVSKLINQEMHKVSGYTYKVTGPWQQPAVQEVSVNKIGRIPLRN